jgi:hypothetical protein
MLLEQTLQHIDLVLAFSGGQLVCQPHREVLGLSSSSRGQMGEQKLSVAEVKCPLPLRFGRPCLLCVLAVQEGLTSTHSCAVPGADACD